MAGQARPGRARELVARGLPRQERLARLLLLLRFPKQEDEAYPYLSRRRAVDEGQFERRGRQPPRYEQKVRLKDDGVVEYAVIKKIEKTATTTTTMTTTRRNEEEDALSEIYSRMHEGILGGSNTSDDFTRSRKATAKEVREFALFGSDEAFETRRLKGPPLYQTLDTHRLENFYVCETQSQSAFGKSTMNTFVSSDRSKRFIQFKMIDTNSRVFEVYEGSNAIEIDPYDGSIVLVARGTAKVKGLLKTFAHKQVANALVSKIRTNLEKTCEDINHANNVNNNNNNHIKTEPLCDNALDFLNPLQTMPNSNKVRAASFFANS